MIYNSSKAPEGVVLQGRAFVWAKGFDSGGHAMERQICAPGVCAHSRRAKSYTYWQQDVHWTHLIHLTGWPEEWEAWGAQGP